ncbi:hypothetical protein GDO86_012598 [Hymenochirus boettgeri]|uniref:Uncharacterized protein n=1 Tax=Hymenochirus boettgeri TaxID=247094 RepID=A0A8T2ITE7_9PIPI|nr:hypothetical protein GDO86_012598 [Hymenochirus boettgeri]
MAQHRRANSSGQDSAVYLHLKDKGHTFEDCNVNILAKERDWFKRGVKEAIYVKIKKPSLNREPKHKHLVSLYDDNFCRPENSILPALRSYNGNQLAWIPERSDYPLQDPPTKFGLLQEKEKHWRQKLSVNPRSLYSASFLQPPPSAYSTVRFGVAPRILSSTIYPTNNNNKSVYFRDSRHLQVPGYYGQSTSENLPLKSVI